MIAVEIVRWYPGLSLSEVRAIRRHDGSLCHFVKPKSREIRVLRPGDWIQPHGDGIHADVVPGGKAVRC